MKLATVIATMDRPAYLERAILSLSNSHVVPDEVIVVDDGRDPSTQEMVVEWTARWSAVRYLASGGCGTSAARNLGAQAAASNLLLITDDDCLVDEDCIGRVVETFEMDPEVQCVTGSVLPYGDGSGKVGVALMLSRQRRQWKGRTYPWGIGSSSNISFRREAFLRIGGFDQELGPGTRHFAAEDLDLLYRVLKAGAKIVYQPEATIYHDQWRSRSQARRRRADYARGIAAFLSKHIVVHRDSFALRMLLVRLWEDVPLLALMGLSKRNLELELVSLYQLWGLATGLWVAGRYYQGKRHAGDARVSVRT
ncbi:MAG: glycosyltransferase [Chloroflexota bacterium]|nr:MAG: glycosyltransferase [Chloroflexota bacterium]